MERQLVTKPGTQEAKANDYRPSSLSHEPHFQTRGFLHSRKNLSNKPKLYPAKLQTKLEVSQPGDSYEQETEQVDEMPSSSISSIEFSKIPVFPDQVQRKCSNFCAPHTGFNSTGLHSERILQSQITADNKAVQRLIKSGALQAKLKISQPNDIYEQEADRVSEKVMRMPDPAIPKKQKCPLRNDALCKEDKIDEITVMRKEAGAQIRPSSFQDNTLFRQQKPTKPELSTTPKSYDEKSAPVFALPLIHRLVYYKDTDSYNDLVTGVRYSRKELGNYAESARNQINRYRTVISILHCKLKELQGNPSSGNPNKPANEYISEAFYEEAQKSFFVTSDTIGGYTEAAYPYVKDFCGIVMPETEENPFFIFPFWQHERSHQKTCLSNKENYRKNGLSELAANVEVADEFNDPIFLITDEINSYEVTVRELEKELSAFFSGSIDTASKGPMSLPETYSIHRKAALDQNESVPYPRTSASYGIYDVLRSSGQPLDTQTRVFFESRFGYDFSDVKVHTDPKAAESARAVNALAFTVGRNIVFGATQYQPEKTAGRQLLAHEMVHVVQQSSTIPPITSNTISLGSKNNSVKAVAEFPYNRILQTVHENGYRDKLVEKVDMNMLQVQRQPAQSVSIVDISSDIERIKEDLDSLFYTEGIEENVIGILRRWAAHGSCSSGYLDWIFDGLQFPMKGIFSDKTYYDAMLDRFDRADEIRQMRECTIRYRGRESTKEYHRQAEQARKDAEQRDADIKASLSGGWVDDIAEGYDLPSTPKNLYLAKLEIRRLGYKESDKLLPCEIMASNMLSKLPKNDRPKALLRKVHFVTESERIERRKGQMRSIVKPLLEILLWATAEKLATFAIETIAVRLFAAEARSATALVVNEGETVAGLLARRGATKEGFVSAERSVIVGDGFTYQIKSVNPVTGEVTAVSRSLTSKEVVTLQMNIDTGIGIAKRGSGEILHIRGRPVDLLPVNRGSSQLYYKFNHQLQAMEKRLDVLSNHPEARFFQRDLENIRLWGNKGREKEALELLKKLSKEVETAEASLEASMLETIPVVEKGIGLRVIEYQPKGERVPVQIDAASPLPSDKTGQRLLEHVERAVKRFEEEGLTDNQIASLNLLENNERSTLYDAYRGSRIDAFAKQAVMEDEELQHVYVTVLKERGPDFFDSETGIWYDITTTGAWKKHVKMYGEQKVPGFRLPTETLMP